MCEEGGLVLNVIDVWLVVRRGTLWEGLAIRGSWVDCKECMLSLFYDVNLSQPRNKLPRSITTATSFVLEIDCQNINQLCNGPNIFTGNVITYCVDTQKKKKLLLLHYTINWVFFLADEFMAMLADTTDFIGKDFNFSVNSYKLWLYQGLNAGHTIYEPDVLTLCTPTSMVTNLS